MGALIATGACALVLLAALLTQVPAVQTRMVMRAIDSLNERIDGRISVRRAYILPFNTLIIKDALITDKHPADTGGHVPQDTLLHASTLILTFGGDLFDGGVVNLKRVSAEGVEFNLVFEDDRQLNLKRVFGLSHKGTEARDEGIPNLFRIGRLNARNLTYRQMNVRTGAHRKPAATPPADGTQGRIDFKDMEVKLSIVKARDFHFLKEGVSAEVLHAAMREKCGYDIQKISGKLSIVKGKTTVSDISLTDNWSDVRFDEFSMSYADGRSFGDFIHKVSMHAELRDSRVSGRTVCTFTRNASFSPELKIGRLLFDGTVADMTIGELTFSDSYGTEADMSGRIVGIQHPREARFDADVKRLTACSDGLRKLLEDFGLRTELHRFAPGRAMDLSLKGKGSANALRLDGGLRSEELGTLRCGLNVNGLIDGDPEINGSVTTEDLDIGSVIGDKTVRQCSMHAALNASICAGKVNMRVDTLYVSRLNLLGYDYGRLAATGTFNGNEFDGRVICSDPNLNFLFQGIFTLSQKTSNALYKFYFNLGYADLHALNIDKRSISRASGTINANYMSFADGKIVGDVDIGRIVLESPAGRHEIGDISLSSHSSGAGHKIMFSSGFAEGTFVTDSSPLRAIDIFKDAVLRESLPVFADNGRQPERGTMDLDFRFADTKDLLAFFRPGIYIADGSTVSLDIDAHGGMSADMRSQRFAIMDKYAKDIDIRADNSGGQLNLFVSSSELKAGIFKLTQARIGAEAVGGRVDATCIFNTGDGGPEGKINAFAELSRNGTGRLAIRGGTFASSVSLGGNAWDIGESRLAFEDGDFHVNGADMRSGNQRITLDGTISRRREDSLTVRLSGLELSSLSDAAGLELGGHLSGHLKLMSPMSGVPKLMADMESGETLVSGRPVGKLKLHGRWVPQGNMLELQFGNELAGKSTFNARAQLDDKMRLSSTISLDGFDMGYFSDLRTGVYSDLQGGVSGDISVSGPMDRLSVRSSGIEVDGMVKIGFTDVRYYLKGPLSMDNGGMAFHDISISDENGGRGVLTGGLRFDRFRDMRADMAARFSGLRLLDIKAGDNDAFYGRVGGSGTMRIEGSLKDLKLSVDAMTAGGGDIYIPLKAGKASSTNLLTFKKPEKWVDPYERMMEEMSSKAGTPGNLDISLHVVPNPEMSCHLEIDKSSGNAIVARGNGDIDIDINPGKDILNFNGDYNITEGNFHYSAIGITSRDFAISNGSNIKFEGDIMNSSLNINASYTTKVSLSTLIADTTSVGTRRNVICGINVSDRIRNPQLKFSIDIPDLDPTTESQVRGVLNTEDKVQRQFLSLLVANSFIPEDRSGISNNSSLLFSNVSEIMAGQLNNILSHLNIPLDLGLKYQPTDEGEDLFDVAVSTKLFDNRVTVNGNLSNNQNSVNRESGDVAGDLDIGIKLDRAGSVQLSLFSHSADLYSNYLDNLQRNGIGIGYRKEFRTMREFWRDLFSKRTKRRERALLEAIRMNETEKVTTDIE